MSKFFSKFVRPTLLDKTDNLDDGVKKLTRWDILNSLYSKDVEVSETLLKSNNITSYELINFVSNNLNYIHVANMAQVQLYGASPMFVFKFLDACIQKQKVPYFKVGKAKSISTKEYDNLLKNLCMLYNATVRSVKIWLAYDLLDESTIALASSNTFLGGKQ
jgi:hypothetical protein